MCLQFWSWYCHIGGQVIGTYACGEVPTGGGGSIQPGVYKLTAMVEFEDVERHFGIPGNNFSQTLFVSPTSILVVSDDSNTFTFVRSFTYTVSGTTITFTPTYRETDGEYGPWAHDPTFTASPTQLDIYSARLGYWASYQLVE
jgi:hypothetical protein